MLAGNSRFLSSEILTIGLRVPMYHGGELALGVSHFLPMFPTENQQLEFGPTIIYAVFNLYQIWSLELGGILMNKPHSRLLRIV